MQAQSRSSLPMLLMGALLLLIVGGAGMWFFLQQGDDDSDQGLALAPGEIFMEPAADVGPDPYVDTPLAPPPDPTLAAPAVQEAATVQPPPQVSIQSNSGAQPGLYGGSMNDSQCMVDQLVGFLGSNPEKAAAWVAAQNADPNLRYAAGTLTTANIPDYIASLTPIVLLADTRVTNHGFVAGKATPRQSVLQKGTAVLVDPYGVPRARCYCGNPLLPPQPSNVQVTYVGKVWPDFDPAAVAVVSSAPQPQTSFQIKMPNGTVVQLPVGSVVQPVATAGGVATQPPAATTPGASPVAAGTTPGTPAGTTPGTPAGTTPGTPAAGAIPVQTPYTVQMATDPFGRISMPVPTGWETRSKFYVSMIGGLPTLHQINTAAPSLAATNDPSTFYSQPSVQVRQYWPSDPAQPLDPIAVLDATPSTICSQKGSPEPFSHPTYGSGTAITMSGCQNNPTAELRIVVLPQPDGSVVQIRMGILEERDRSHINTILDSLTLPTVSAPAPPSVPQACSDDVPNAAGPMDVTVTNNTTQVMRIFWHEYPANGCALQDPADIWVAGPGETVTLLGTYEGAYYSAVALDGSVYDSFMVSAAGSPWTIR